MSNIKLNVDVLISQSSSMRNICSELVDIQKNIENELALINGNLSTEISNSFSNTINSMKTVFAEMIQGLDDNALKAEAVAIKFREADGSIKFGTDIASISVEDATEILYSNLNAPQSDSVDTKDRAEFFKEYIDIINGTGSSEEKIQSVVAWLKKYSGYVKSGKSFIEKTMSKDDYFEKDLLDLLPDDLKDIFKDTSNFISGIDDGITVVEGTTKYIGGLTNGDSSKAMSGANDLLDVIMGCKVGNDKIDNVLGIGSKGINKDGVIRYFAASRVENFEGKILIDCANNMRRNWLDSLANESNVSEVYWNTFAQSTVETFSSTVTNLTNLAIGYIPAKVISNVMGYDLQEAYESLSNKTGFTAVLDVFNQAEDLFKENSSWENWKSGAAIMVDELSNIFKKG